MLLGTDTYKNESINEYQLRTSKHEEDLSMSDADSDEANVSISSYASKTNPEFSTLKENPIRLYGILNMSCNASRIISSKSNPKYQNQIREPDNSRAFSASRSVMSAGGYFSEDSRVISACKPRNTYVNSSRVGTEYKTRV